MRSLPILLLVSVLPVTAIFFGSGGGSGGCGCSAPPACPPAPACAPPPVCPAPRPCAAGAPTHQAATPIEEPAVEEANEVRYHPTGSPSELDLRAAALGVVPLSSSEDAMPSTQLKLLERLGEGDEDVITEAITEIPEEVVAPVRFNIDDSDLFGGLHRGGGEIRRHPVNAKLAKAAKTIGSAEERTETARHSKKDEKTRRHIDSATESPVVTTTPGEADTKCNSQVLRRLMVDNMSENSATSKRDINVAAETLFGGNVDVICSRGHFSYVFSSNLYCEVQKGLITCIAFRQVS